MRINWKNWVQEFAQGAMDLVYPPHCESCGTPLPDSEKTLCLVCFQKLPYIRIPRCHRCSLPFDGAIAQNASFECPDCLNRHFDFESNLSAFRFRDPIRHFILDLKYHGQTRHAVPLGMWLAEAIQADPRFQAVPLDAIIPIPLHPVRRRERGFNQAELLSEQLATHLKVPMRPLLRRTRYTNPQTKRDRKERLENLVNAFALTKGASVTGLTVLLVDDVFTTGSTLEECSKLLKHEGAKHIFCATVARG